MTNATGRVLVFGNATVDLIQRVVALPKPGETVLSQGLERCAGGKGLNQALAAARAGAAVHLVAPIGDDSDGAFLRTALAPESGLTADWRVLAAPTDVSTIWVAADGENAIVSTATCARGLTPGEVPVALASLTAGDVLVLQGNLSATTTESAARLARDLGARVVLNTAPVAWDLLPVLACVDIVVANEPEARTLTDATGDAALTRLRALGPSCAILTRGSRGAVMAHGDRVVTIPAPNVRTIDTAGAGDVAVGTLAAGVALGEPADTSLRFAVEAASLSVTRPGTTSSFPTKADIAHLRTV